MSTKRALFGSRKARAGQATLAEILHRLLEAEGEAPRRRGRKAIRPALEALPPERFAPAAAAAVGGELVLLRAGRDQPVLAGLSLDPEDSAGEALRAAAARLAALAAAAPERPAAAAAAAPERPAAGFLLSSQRVSAATLAILKLRDGGGRKLQARGGRMLLQVEEAFAAAVEAGFAAGDEALEDLGPGDPGSLEPPAGLELERSQEFVVSHFFLPPFFPAGQAAAGAAPPEAAAFWDALSTPSEPEPGALWFVASLGDPKAGLALAFECAAAGRPDRERYAALLAPVLREAWSRACVRLAKLAPAGSAPRFGALAAAPEAFLRGSVRVSGEIRVGAGGFPLALRLPPRFVAALAAALKPLPKAWGAGGALTDLVMVNEALLERWASGFRDSFLRPRAPAGGGQATAGAPLAPLLAAMGAHDASLALQNCILPRFGAKELPYLFFHHAVYVRNGKRAMRPVALAPFRDGDVTRLLPPAAREEWERERRFDLPQRTQTGTDCAAASDEAARLVWEAARSGRLELGTGTRELLDRLVGKKLEEAAKARLAALAAKDLPFGFLAGLDRKDAARIVDRVSNRDLALACLGDERHLDLLHAAMGSGRRRDFDEERDLDAERLRRGELDPERAVSMKIELLGRMKAIEEDLKRERSLETAARQPRAAGQPRLAGQAPRERPAVAAPGAAPVAPAARAGGAGAGRRPGAR